jgi:predicted ribosome quality control (RQC) complex YloA/Tae2 family protein
MLSLRELRRAARVLEVRFSGAKLRKISLPDEYKLILRFESSSGQSHVLISPKPGYARICIADQVIQTDQSSSSFCEYARAHLIGGRLFRTEMQEHDRQVRLHLQSHSEYFVLIFSILGSRSNVYLLNQDGSLVHSMRPLEVTRSELRIGNAWTNPRGTVPSPGIDRWETVPDELYLESIGKTYRRLEEKNEAELLVRRIENAVKKERSYLSRKSINLQEDLAEARQAEAYRQKGELLKTALHTVKPGDESITVIDYRTGEIVEIPLDPKMSPVSNLESYFARYRKDSRGVEMIRLQLESVQSAHAELDRIELQLREALWDESSEINNLESLISQPGIRRLLKRRSSMGKTGQPSGKKKRTKEIAARLMPKRYRTQDGLEIWVGRSDEGNDYLTTRLARGNDLFFHLEAYPGSHVVLRTEGRVDPPQESVLDSCELAVHFSKLKDSQSADVCVAPIKEVRKPKGAKSGLVYVRKSKTIHLRRDPKRLQSILATRLDD